MKKFALSGGFPRRERGGENADGVAQSMLLSALLSSARQNDGGTERRGETPATEASATDVSSAPPYYEELLSKAEERPS